MLKPIIVSSLDAAIVRASVNVFADPAHYQKPADWAYLVFLAAAQFSPLAVGTILAGVLAPASRLDHAVVALDLCIVLWMVGVL